MTLPRKAGRRHMTVKFTVQIEREGEGFVAYSADVAGTEAVIAGYGADPYEALGDLVDQFREADLYRPESE